MGILGNASLALMELPSSSPIREHISQIEIASQSAADLCKQMLAYSGKGRFVLQTINLTDLVKDMAHLLKISISKRAVLKYNFEKNLPAIEVDPTQVRQIVMNLITNASEAIGENNGVISISTGFIKCDKDYLMEAYLEDDIAEGTYVYLEVSDNGCGMSKEAKARIFDPFFTTKFSGRGLGLAAVLGIVRGHKGTLKVYSEEGKGSTFKILFPSCGKPAEVVESDIDKADYWTGSGTVLIVDDEETVLAISGKILERAGFKVLMARDGREGIDLYKRFSDEIDIVLLDMTMPNMNGEEAFEEIRRINSDVKVILSSGYNEQDATDRFFGKGLAGFIQKPYRANDLTRIIKDVLT